MEQMERKLRQLNLPEVLTLIPSWNDRTNEQFPKFRTHLWCELNEKSLLQLLNIFAATNTSEQQPTLQSKQAINKWKQLTEIAQILRNYDYKYHI